MKIIHTPISKRNPVIDSEINSLFGCARDIDGNRTLNLNLSNGTGTVYISMTQAEATAMASTMASPDASVAAVATGVLAEVAGERSRQILTKGYTQAFDDKRTPGELAAAGSAYAIKAACGIHPSYTEVDPNTPPTIWPWAAKAFKPDDARTNLIKAAALIISEIERMDRDALAAAHEAAAAEEQAAAQAAAAAIAAAAASSNPSA
jgi:hypothetical protein